MRTYASFLDFLYGNEMFFQLLMLALLCLPWRARRAQFVWRGLGALALYSLPLWISVPTPWYYLVVFSLTFFGIWLCFDKSARECLFHAVNAYCIQYIVSGIIYSVFWLCVGNGVQFTLFRTFSMACTLVGCALTGVVYLRWNLKKRENEGCINSSLVLVITGVFLFVAVFVSHYGEASIFMWNVFGRMWLKIFSVFYGGAMLVINIMNSSNHRLKEERNILQLLLNKDKEQYELAKLSATDINMKYHDLKQRGESAPVFEGEMDELKIFSHYFTGNKALDIVLTEKAEKCKKQSIRFLCEAEGEVLARMKSYHIYSLISNCIENAMTGLVGVEEDKREIRVSVKQKNCMGVIRVENYYEGECALVDGIPQTTKKDKANHGYGIKSICSVAEKYGGNVRFQTEDHLFVVLIAFPLGDKK